MTPLEAERGAVSVRLARRLRDRDVSLAVGPKPGGRHVVPIAADDTTRYLLDRADDVGEPVAVAAVRDGRLVVYRVERVWSE